MADAPNVMAIDQSPSALNKPASGTYGEKAALANLQAQLPKVQPPDQGQAQGGPSLPPISTSGVKAPDQTLGRPPMAGGPPPPGISPAILGPTTMPDVPVNTPLAQPPQNPVANAVDPSQQRLALLDALASNPGVSAQTREWALHVRNLLIATSKQG